MGESSRSRVGLRHLPGRATCRVSDAEVERGNSAQADEHGRALNSVDLSKLPQLEGWIAGGAADPRAFLLANVTVGEAAALSLLFWPAFTEYRDCVFLSFLFERHSVDRWFDELKGDKSAVESVVNHVHLWDVFAPKSEDEYAILSGIAPRIGEMWLAALKHQFPGREFVISVADESVDYGPTISFRSG
jgi:hypothetical protein